MQNLQHGVDSWERRIARANALSDADPASRSLLFPYVGILQVQRDCFLALQNRDLSGALERDLAVVLDLVPPLLEGVGRAGPAQAAEDAQAILDGLGPAFDAVLLAAWHQPVADSFLPRLVLQVYAESLLDRGLPPADRGASPTGPYVCSFCGAPPQLSVLHESAGAEGGRQLLCSLCSMRWPFRRLVCAACGEEDERRLAYHQAPTLGHLRVETCETCRRYLKTVDLTRLGHAVPVVDEVAGAVLDVWARAQGYEKVAVNLVGL